jgi:hypothetical protein
MIIRLAYRLPLAALVLLYVCEIASAEDVTDSGDGSTKAASAWPNIYLDLRTNYATATANSLSIGFSPVARVSAATCGIH